MEVIEIRQLIEPRAASLAAKRVTPQELEELKGCMEGFGQHLDENDLPGMIFEDSQFHRLIANATKNKTLTLLMNTITRYLPLVWKATLRLPQRPQKTIIEHQEIYNALINHDPDAANDAMVLHLENAFTEMHMIFNSQASEIAE